MPAQPPARSGVLLIRAWIEDGGLRARVIGQPPGSLADVEGAAAAGIPQVIELVRSWLEYLAEP